MVSKKRGKQIRADPSFCDLMKRVDKDMGEINLSQRQLTKFIAFKYTTYEEWVKHKKKQKSGDKY